MGVENKNVYKTKNKKGLFKLRDVRFSICLGHDLLYIFFLWNENSNKNFLLFELWAHDIWY